MKITKEIDMAFIDAEKLLFTNDAQKLIRNLAKDVDEQKIRTLTKEICKLLEGQTRANAFVTLYNLLHSFTAKMEYTHR